MLAANTKVAIGRALGLMVLMAMQTGCVVYPDGTVGLPTPVPMPAPEPVDHIEQPRNIVVTTWQGSREAIVMHPGEPGVRAGFVRVCMRNNKSGVRTLIHGVPNINNLETNGSGAESCANFPSNIVLNLTARAAGRAATLSNAQNIYLSDYDGRWVRFIWQ